MESLWHQKGDLNLTLILDTFLIIFGSLLAPEMGLRDLTFQLRDLDVRSRKLTKHQDRPEDPQRPSQGPPKHQFWSKVDPIWHPEALILLQF